jgi:hypothetical protein
MSAGRRLPLRNFSFFLVGKKSLTGLLVSFTDSGGIKVRIPLKMWGKSISTGRLVQEFRGGLNRLTMANFLKLLNEHVEAYLRTSFQYPLSQNQVVTHFSLPLKTRKCNEKIGRLRNFFCPQLFPHLFVYFFVSLIQESPSMEDWCSPFYGSKSG